MTASVQDNLDQLIQSEWDYIESQRDGWSLLNGVQDMEILEHVLRCILHLDLTESMGQESSMILISPRRLIVHLNTYCLRRKRTVTGRILNGLI
jgi:hypothetical protein